MINGWDVKNYNTEGKWHAVRCIAVIKNTKSGEIVEHNTVELLFDGDELPCHKVWSEGSWSINSNRELFFMLEKGEKTYEIPIDLGKGKYLLNLKNAANGKIYYQEF